MTEKVYFSIQTCTYNRADTLVRTYASLTSQTLKDFAWLVYDNGSTDGTRALVERWQKEADFPIVILGREDNAAVQLSWNIGIGVAKGEFWTLLDSDDACVPTALEVFKAKWEAIPDDQKNEFVGVACTAVNQHGDLVGNSFPTDPFDTNALDLTYKYKVKGEKWGVMRVDVLREFPFSTENHHQLPGVIWRAIATQYLSLIHI